MTCEDLVAGCFAGDKAPFAQHQSDAERAIAYLHCCVKEQLPWSVVEGQIRDYLNSKRSKDATDYYDKWIDQQVARAQKLMAPWLEHDFEEGGNVVSLGG